MTTRAALLRVAEECEGASEPSTDIDERIALACGIWRAWLSKHRYWSFDGPEGNHFCWPESVPRFDSQTGQKIEMSEHEPWSGWGDHADLPAYTASLDAALTLVPEGKDWTLSTEDEGRYWAEIVERGCPGGGPDVICRTPALALCAAALRARADTGDAGKVEG